MRQQIKYQVLSIPGKLKLDIKLSLEAGKGPGGEYTSTMNEDVYTNLTLYPITTLSIIRIPEIDENGIKRKAPWDRNDTLSIGRYNLPLLVNELSIIFEDLKRPNLYVYADKEKKRLELDTELAMKLRRVFPIGDTIIELSPVVITLPDTDESKVEGIKMKFNKEPSSVLLTVNDMESLIFTLKGMDIDNILINLYNIYISKSKIGATSTVQSDSNIKVDILPKDDNLPF